MRFTHSARTPALAAQRVVKCQYRGSSDNFGGDAGKYPPSKLIIPGQGGSSAPRPGGGLVIPGSDSSSGSAVTGTPPSLDSPAVRNFRPPPGFMDADGVQQTETTLSPQEMLNKLQAQAGHWHQLAKLLPQLQAKGFDAFAVEEATGLERKMQNLWTSSASIYDALKKSGLVSDSIMSYFDVPGSEVLLHEFRFLSLRQRATAVTYIAENELNDAECAVLARAMKEHERRSGQKDGFSDSPADCLAYKYYRDALECRKQEQAETYAKKGLAVVESDTARLKLQSIVSGDTDVEPIQLKEPQAMLAVLRLEKTEVGCRPIALAGSLNETKAEKVRKAPKVSSEGPFATFTVPSEGASWQWVPLPAWAIVSFAGRPVGLDVPNCGDLPSLKATTRAKSDDDLRKLQGPGLMVVDIEPATGIEVFEPTTYYLTSTPDGSLDVTEGGAIKDATSILGPILFLCRPPARDTTGATTSELLSM